MTSALLFAMICAGASAAEEGPEGEVFGLNAWPFFESARLPSGGTRESALLLYHRTRDAEGRLYSQHYGPYFDGPGYRMLLPFYYRFGEKDSDSVKAVIPFWLRGENWRVSPVGLSAWWREKDGSEWTWITPLYHRRTDAEGRERHMHAGPYFRGQGYQVLFPLAFRFGEGENVHEGVVPFYARGPGWWVAPPVLGASWTTADGGRQTWVSPLFHRRTDSKGRTKHMHLVNYFSGPGYQIAPPVFYRFGPEGRKHTGIVPLWFSGPNYWAIPPLLAGEFPRPDGTTEGMFTPFVRWHRGQSGEIQNLLAFNYIRRGDRKILFPLAAWGPGYWSSPLTLSGSWQNAEGGRTTLVTPLHHRRTDRFGRFVSAHVGPFIAGPNYQAVPPLWYRVRDEKGRGWHSGLIPLYAQGPGYKVSPPLLSGWTALRDGGSVAFSGPFYHHRRDRYGQTVSRHLLNWYSDDKRQILFPVAYRTANTFGIIPLYHSGPNYRVIPPLLASWRRAEDGSTSVISPLFHMRRDPEGNRLSMHAGPFIAGQKWWALPPLAFGFGEGEGRFATYLGLWSEGHDWRVIFPLHYRFGEHWGWMPVAFGGPDYSVNLPLMSMSLRHDSGAETKWVTPFYHSTRNEDGSLRHRHFANYMEWSGGTRAVFPLYWQWRTEEGGTRGVIPLVYAHGESEDGVYRSFLPPVFGYRRGGELDKSWQYQALHPFSLQLAKDGEELNLLWRVLHYRREGDERTLTVGPLWHFHRPARNAPASFAILGGLLGGRAVNYERGTYQYRGPLGSKIGPRRKFEPVASVRSIDLHEESN